MYVQLAGVCRECTDQFASHRLTCGVAAADIDGPSRQGQPSESPEPSTSGRPSHPLEPRTTSRHSNSRHEEEVLTVGGQRYHVAHTVLLLLRMLQAYMTFQEAVPLLAAETARRAVDLLKVDITRWQCLESKSKPIRLDTMALMPIGVDFSSFSGSFWLRVLLELRRTLACISHQLPRMYINPHNCPHLCIYMCMCSWHVRAYNIFPA